MTRENEQIEEIRKKDSSSRDIKILLAEIESLKKERDELRDDVNRLRDQMRGDELYNKWKLTQARIRELEEIKRILNRKRNTKRNP